MSIISTINELFGINPESAAARAGRQAVVIEDAKNPFEPGCKAHTEWQAAYDDELEIRKFTQQW